MNAAWGATADRTQMSEVNLRQNRSGSAADRMMVPLWAIFAGILVLQVAIVAIGFRFLG